MAFNFLDKDTIKEIINMVIRPKLNYAKVNEQLGGNKQKKNNIEKQRRRWIFEGTQKKLQKGICLNDTKRNTVFPKEVQILGMD